MNLLFAGLLLAAPVASADGGVWLAQAEEDEEFLKLWQEVRAEVEQMIYEFPELPPTIELHLGFRYFDVEGAARAMEYAEPGMFGTAKAHFTSYSETQRINLGAHFEGLSDYSADLAYWFGDLVFARALVEALQHNLDEIALVDLGEAQRYRVDVAETVDEPHVHTTRGRLVVRLKAPGYPAHLFAKGETFWRRNFGADEILGGTGYWDDLARTTVASTVETLMTDVQAGANAHLGWVELQLAHSESWLDRRTQPLRFNYSGIPDVDGPVYPHNAVPRLRGRRDEINLHTAYTGRIVASATAARQTRTNETVDLTETALVGKANVRWLPFSGLVFTGGYSFRDLSHEGSDTVELRDLAENGLVTSFALKPQVDSRNHTFRTHLRYRPLRELALDAHARRYVRERDNADVWMLPKRSVRDVFGGEVSYRFGRSVDLRGVYEREMTDAPSYNVDPDTRDRVRAEIRWNPVDRLTLFGEYELTNDSRAESRLDLLDTQISVRGFDNQTHNAFVMAVLTAPPALTLSTSYGYIHLAHDPTLAFQTFSQATPGFETDSGASYVESSHIATLNVHHAAASWLDLGADLFVSSGQAVLTPTLDAALEPLSIERLSRTRVRQSSVKLKAELKLPDAWHVELNGLWNEIRFGNARYNPRRNGRVLGGALSVGKEW